MRLLIDKFNFKWFLSRNILLINKVEYIDPVPNVFKLGFFFFRLLGIKITEKKLWLGDVEKKNGNNIYHRGVELASVISKDLSGLVLETNDSLSKSNAAFGRNTLRLSLAKAYMPDLLEFSIKIVYLQSMARHKKSTYMRKPAIIPWDYIVDSGNFDSIQFYSDKWIDFKDFLRFNYSYLRTMARRKYLFYRFYFYSTYDVVSNINNTVLSPKEDSIGSDQRYRNQQFWVDETDNKNSYFVYDSTFNSIKRAVVTQSSNTTVLNAAFASLAIRKHKKDIRFKKLKIARSNLKAKLKVTFNFPNSFALVKAITLIDRSFEIGCIALMIGANKYVYKETHNSESDAIQLISKDIGVTTYAIQYSCLGVKNPSMQTTVDKFLIFSNGFKKVFADECFFPQDFIVNGYPFRGVVDKVSDGALKTRKTLKQLGVDCIVGYFDENVQVGKFGLTSRRDHFEEIVHLADFVLANPKRAVIVKSQFNRNNLEQYAENSTISSALLTGRLVTLSCGEERRNNIYPTEIAIASDICIGNLVGSTASLEVALTGTASVVLNPYRVKVFADFLLGDHEIIFFNLQNFLKKIGGMTALEIKNSSIGDWKVCIKDFDPFPDESSLERIREAVLDC